MDKLTDEEFAALVDKELADDVDLDTHARLRRPENLRRWFSTLLEVEARVSRRLDNLMEAFTHGIPHGDDELRALLDSYRRTLRVERKVRRRLVEVLFLTYEGPNKQ